MDDTTTRDRVGRVEALLEEIEGLDDPVARDKATEVVQAVLGLYGEGLERIVDLVAARDDGTLARALADDDLVAHLLLLHDLHPVSLEERIRGALEGVRPYLESHGGNVELLGVEDGIARLRLEGSCSGCPSSTMTLKLAIEDAIHKAAPDVVDIEAEGAVEPAPAPGPGLIQLDVVSAPAQEPIQLEPAPAWSMAGGIPQVPGGGPVMKQVSGEPVLFVTLDGDHYAYRPSCAACGESLEDAPLEGDALGCPACGQRYDVRRAGRALDADDLHLDPVPLLVDDSGLVKVALGSVAA